MHVPQISVPPQASLTEPQFAPALAHVFGVHPHALWTPPPPQVCGATHDPHSIVPPHPSATTPQFLPSPAHVAGAHCDLAMQEPSEHTSPSPHFSSGGHATRAQIPLRHAALGQSSVVWQWMKGDR